MELSDTRCCAKCKTPYGCGLKYDHCPCHDRAVERAAKARRDKTVRAALRGLNDPEWTGEG